MARQPRVEYAGAIYHVTMRMVGSAWEQGRELRPEACLFGDDAEREHFLGQLAERVETYGVRLFAYCLMLSHVHLYLETPKGNLSRFMHSLGTAYTVYINLRRQRHGPLVGRYKAKLVEGDNYHLSLSRYLHLNPVRVASVQKLAPKERLTLLRTYEWSSYYDYSGQRKGPSWLSSTPVLALCGRRPSEQRRAYVRFVEGALVDSDEETASMLHGNSLAVGDEAFQDWVREQMIEGARGTKRGDDVILRREETCLSADEILSVTAEQLGVETVAFLERRRNSPLRSVAARMLCTYGGLTQRETADVLGIGTGAAVGQQLRALESCVCADRRLGRRVAQLERCLSERCGVVSY